MPRIRVGARSAPRPQGRNSQFRKRPPRKKKPAPKRGMKAGDRARTGDNDVGNVVLYQLSYARKSGS